MKKGDKIILIIISILIAISTGGTYIYKYTINGSEHIAEIKQNGEVIQTINLGEIKEVKQWEITSEEGFHNTIKVEPKRIRIIEADCPHEECVKTEWISDHGEMIVCMPNKLVISIKGESNDVDITTY